jgi:hypothetical protein
VRFDADGNVVAIRPDGEVLPHVPPPSPTDGGAVERANRSLGLQIGPRTCVPRWYGDPLRLPDVVDAMLFARKRE